MSKLNIRINGYTADLEPDTRLTLERYNPLFDFSTVQGSRVYDFSLPFSPTNDRIFNWYRLQQSAYPSASFYAEKYTHGVLVEKGFVKLRDASGRYNFYFTQNLGDFFGIWGNVTLNRLPLGSEAIPGTLVANPNPATAFYAFPIIKNPMFYGTNTQAGFNGLVNEHNGTSYVTAAPKVPMFFLHAVMREVAELCGFTLAGEFMSDTTMQRLLVYNTFSLDGRTTIEMANHLPELTVRDFFVELRKLFNLYFAFDVQNRVLTIRFCDTLMRQATSQDWTSKSSPRHDKLPVLSKKLELDWELDGGDGRMKTPPADMLRYITADNADNEFSPAFTIKTRFSTLQTDAATGYAFAEQPGITPNFGQLNNRFGARLLFFNGLVSSRPVATRSHGTCYLGWSGSNNLRDKCYAAYEAWRSNTYLLKKPVTLTPLDLERLDFHRQLGNYMRVHLHGQDYYVGGLSPELPLKGATVVELWKA